MNALVFGATSAMAGETLKHLLKSGDSALLVGRDAEKLDLIKSDLEARLKVKIQTATLDFLAYEKHEAFVRDCFQKLSSVDVAFFAHGHLPDQKECEADFIETLKSMDINFTSVVSLLTHVANRMIPQKQGRIAVISSVAGERGRQSNYVYGAAKGGLNTFLQGLRNRLFFHGITVTTILPGFVDTPMTAEIKKGPLFVSAATAGKMIANGISRAPAIVYVPSFWRWIMLIIKSIPEVMFKRLRL